MIYKYHIKIRESFNITDDYLIDMELDELVSTFSEAFGCVLKEDFDGAVNEIKGLKYKKDEENEGGEENKGITDYNNTKNIIKYIAAVLQLMKDNECMQYIPQFVLTSVGAKVLSVEDALMFPQEPIHFSSDTPFFEMFTSAMNLMRAIKPESDPSYFELITESIDKVCRGDAESAEMNIALKYLTKSVSERVFNQGEVEFLTRVYADSLITCEKVSYAEALLSAVLNAGIKRRNLIEDHMFVHELNNGTHFIDYFQDLFSPHRFLIARNLAFRFNNISRDDLAQKYNYLAHISHPNNLAIEEKIAFEEYQRGDASAEEHLARLIYDCGSYNPCVYVAYGKLLLKSGDGKEHVPVECKEQALNAFRTALRGYDFAMSEIEYLPDEFILSALEAAELLEDHEKYEAVKRLVDERGIGASEAGSKLI